MPNTIEHVKELESVGFTRKQAEAQVKMTLEELEKRIEENRQRFETRLDDRLQYFDKRFDERLHHFEERLNERLDFSLKLFQKDLELRLTMRLAVLNAGTISIAIALLSWLRNG